MTSPTVRTTVPLELRCWSQSRKAVNVAGLKELLPVQEEQTPWNTSGTQPPPLFSALTTTVWSCARVVLLVASRAVRSRYGLAGGMVSA